MYSLQELGWDDEYAAFFHPFEEQGLRAGRIAVEHRERYVLYCEFGEWSGEVTGRLAYTAATTAMLPKVGDWVAMLPFEDEQKAIIHEVLPRRTELSRKAAGKSEEQVIAANVNMVFIVQGLDDNFNVNRLQRYLVMVMQSGAVPVIVLNKSDLCDNVEERLAEVSNACRDCAVHATSAIDDSGTDALKAYVKPGWTIGFLGSSGVGKSTLINRICGDTRQMTREVRATDSRGRHTTTRRELILLPEGGILIDTPGMRELFLWDAEDSVGDAFPEIAALADECRFDDCSHTVETGCAILAALEEDQLDRRAYDNFMKLRREQQYLNADAAFLRERKAKWKQIHKQMRQLNKGRLKP